jgi:Flp pilus assembly protein TadG
MKSQRGAAMVEAAIVTPIFLLLLFGLVDFGRYFWTRHVIVEAAAEGGRMAVILEGVTDEDVRAVVLEWAERGGLPSTMTVNAEVAGRGPSETATVTATATGFQFLILPGFIADFAGVREIRAIATVVCERWGT